MKHDNAMRIWSLVFGNLIFVGFIWLAAHATMWGITGGNGDLVVRIFAIIGMCAVLFLINYAIELLTRIKDSDNKKW